MKKKSNKKREIFKWFSWLLLVIIWNYGFPEAPPIQDVLIAVILSLIFIFLKKQKK